RRTRSRLPRRGRSRHLGADRGGLRRLPVLGAGGDRRGHLRRGVHGRRRTSGDRADHRAVHRLTGGRGPPVRSASRPTLEDLLDPLENLPESPFGTVAGGPIVFAVGETVRRVLLGRHSSGIVVGVAVSLAVAQFCGTLVMTVAQVGWDRSHPSRAYIG